MAEDADFQGMASGSAGGADAGMPTPEERAAYLAAREYSKVEISHDGLQAPITIAYKLHGSDDAPMKVLWIGGLATIGSFFHDLVALMLSSANGHMMQVVTFDNRGSGESSTPSGRYTTTSLAKDCKALTNHLGPAWERPHVMGASMGGMIAAEYALLDLARLSSLTLMVTHIGGFGTSTPYNGWSGIMSNMVQKDPEKKVATGMKILFSKQTNADPTSAKYKRLRAVLEHRTAKLKSPVNSVGAFFSQVSATYTHKVSTARVASIKECKLPCLVLRGDQDNLVRTSNSDKIAKLLGVDCVVIPDTGHGLIEEAAGRVAGTIVSFLSTLLTEAI